MAAVKSGIQDRHINQMIEMVEEYLQAANTPETQRLQKELDDTVRPHKGHFVEDAQQKVQDTAIVRARHAYLAKYFPNLQSIMFPAQADGSLPKTANRDMVAINNALNQAVSALSKPAESQSAPKEHRVTTANETKKPATTPKAKPAKFNLEHKLSALNNAKNSQGMSAHPNAQAHLDFILKEINNTSNNKGKESIIDVAFPDLGKYLQKNNAADTTAYIIKATKALLANLSEKSQIPATKPVTAVVNPPKQSSVPTVTETPAKTLSRQPVDKVVKAEASPQKRENPIGISKAIGFLNAYKDHLEKELKRNPGNADLIIKTTAVERLQQKLYDSSGNKEVIDRALLTYKDDISFSRNPILRLFGKTVGWGTTGATCMQNIEKSFKEQTAPQTKTSFGPG